jgi:hypothetical protein
LFTLAEGDVINYGIAWQTVSQACGRTRTPPGVRSRMEVTMAFITATLSDSIGTITFNHDQKRNALSRDLIDALL